MSGTGGAEQGRELEPADEAALDALAEVDPATAERIRAMLDAPGLVGLDDERLDALPDLDGLDDDPDLDEDDEESDQVLDAEAARRARKVVKRAARDAAADAADTESWDSYWEAAERLRKAPTTVIRGVTVTVPHDLPLSFDRRAEQLRASGREQDVRELVGILYGPDALDGWIDAGMGQQEFQAVLVYGLAHGRGEAMTVAQAREAVLTQGKSLLANRAARRNSARSGGPSKRTSSASTGSGRKRSQR